MPKVSDEHLAARRRQILDAALVCFSRRGFHQTPMQAIFEEARLSPGAVYRYFKSKEEIVRATPRRRLEASLRSSSPGPTVSRRARITAVLSDAQRRGGLDPEAAGRVVIAIGQGFAVQNAWDEDLDREAFGAAARGLLSHATDASRLNG